MPPAGAPRQHACIHHLKPTDSHTPVCVASAHTQPRCPRCLCNPRPVPLHTPYPVSPQPSAYSCYLFVPIPCTRICMSCWLAPCKCIAGSTQEFRRGAGLGKQDTSFAGEQPGNPKQIHAHCTCSYASGQFGHFVARVQPKHASLRLGRLAAAPRRGPRRPSAPCLRCRAPAALHVRHPPTWAPQGGRKLLQIA